MIIRDLQTLDYRTTWDLQEQIREQVLNGAEEHLLLVEHPPVITIGRRPNPTLNLVVTTETLKQKGIDFIESNRGGDITFHGPGQLVAYPILRLADHKLTISSYVHTLEKIISRTLEHFGISSFTDPCAVGVWVNSTPSPRRGEGRGEGVNVPIEVVSSQRSCATPDSNASKIAAIGVRIRRGVTLHGVALNVSTDLSYFDLIVPCGLSNRSVTSIHQLLPQKPPAMDDVKKIFVQEFQKTLFPIS